LRHLSRIQIDRIFPYWAIDNFDQCFWKLQYIVAQNICLFYFHGKSCLPIQAQFGLGYILGDFFQNSSGLVLSKIFWEESKTQSKNSERTNLGGEIEQWKWKSGKFSVWKILKIFFAHFLVQRLRMLGSLNVIVIMNVINVIWMYERNFAISTN
jgi:hypothetical protein